jgi:hypothetical protein
MPVVMPVAVPVAAAVGTAPVAGALEVVAGFAGFAAVAAEPVDYAVEVAFGVVDASAAVFPALRLGSRRDGNRGGDGNRGKPDNGQQNGNFHFKSLGIARNQYYPMTWLPTMKGLIFAVRHVCIHRRQ